MMEQVQEKLWLVDGDIVSFWGFPYPTRSVIARLENGGLWIWSPIKLTDELRAQVDCLGRVDHLVSPNKLHHLYLADWKSAYPAAKLWGPQSAIVRHRALTFCEALQDHSLAEWQPDFDQAWFRGSPFLDEVVFFHFPSRTAIVADLIQNFDDHFLRQHWRWWQRPLAYLDGITTRAPGAPREWRLSFIDRRSAREAYFKARSWNCERVIIAHGPWCRSGGAALLEQSLSWINS